jgi:uncharacterized protein YecE (DUF72 family)
MSGMGKILVGTSSWADRLLVSSGWYPTEVNTPAGRLAYYAERFKLVEVDTSYYAIPTPETVSAWADRTPDDFTFNVKAFSMLTGHPSTVAALPRDLRPEGAEGWVRRRDLPGDYYDRLWDRFLSALDPLADADKLGAVLLQFPPWLVRGPGGKQRIVDAAERCRPLRIAVELRHGSWFEGDYALDTLLFLRRHDLTFCCVDMPQGHVTSVPPILASTAEPAMIRFHGHSERWSTGDRQEKFRYAYPDTELAEWAQRLIEQAEQVDQLHVLMNNCCGDQAQRDAATLIELLGDAVDMPSGSPLHTPPDRLF